ncbi:MAG: LysR family transcriptional regulator [Oscillospiraceae bacterium]|nr:LysR family transcriptional regulator [Oscillospiraceae bacterium]
MLNLLHMKHAIAVAKSGSLSKASEVLLIAAPNISRSIKELEADLGITIFERTQNGMKLTLEGEEFITYAKGILGQIDEVEKFYKAGAPKNKNFLFLYLVQPTFLMPLLIFQSRLQVITR